MQFQDIQISDLDLRRQFIELWSNGSYDEAIALLQDTQISGKWQDAENFNTLCAAIVQAENDALKPIASGTDVVMQLAEPTNQKDGDIWFETEVEVV